MGLYYYRARYYTPGNGRFISEDPAGGANLYAYTAGNPINFIDPTGLSFLDGLTNFVAGFGDKITFGGTRWIRKKLGVNGVVDPCSSAYGAGGVTAVVTATILTDGLLSELGMGAEAIAMGGRRGGQLLLEAPSAQRAFSSLGSLEGLTAREARNLLQRHGFRFVSRSKGGNITFRRTIDEVLQVTVRPNGQVIRSVRGTGKRFLASGELTADHSVGEFLGGNFIGP